jgi:hypothetical protein
MPCESLDKDQSVNDIETMSDAASETYGAIRFPMTLLGVAPGLAGALLSSRMMFGCVYGITYGIALKRHTPYGFHRGELATIDGARFLGRGYGST